jgi:DNA-binding transcriptional LysR family regulator
MDWFNCLEAFDLVAKNQSFIRAARELAVPNSVVTKRIQWLEARLHSSLLIRTTRKVSLTEAGVNLHRMVHPLLCDWQDIHKQILDFNTEPQGEITVCLPPNLSNTAIFMEYFNHFLLKFPGIKLNITTTSEPVKLSDGDIDVLIATDKYVLDPGLTIGVRLFSFSYSCYVAPAFIEKYGLPESPADIKDYNCLIFNSDTQWEFENVKYAVSGKLRTDSGSTLISAGLNGAGLIYVPDFFVVRELEDGRLVKLFGLGSGEEYLKIYYLKKNYLPRRVGLFVDLLREGLKVQP